MGDLDLVAYSLGRENPVYSGFTLLSGNKKHEKNKPLTSRASLGSWESGGPQKTGPKFTQMLWDSHEVTPALTSLLQRVGLLSFLPAFPLYFPSSPRKE